MKQISAHSTFTAKWMPLLPGGAALVGLAHAIVTGNWGSDAWFPPVALVFFAVVAVAWYLLALPLADEVHDAGDHLVVRRGSVQEKVPFADIASVEVDRWGRSRRAVLMLRKPGPFGDRIVFQPAVPFNPADGDLLEEDLKRRIAGTEA